jgi:probable HAF family extracellular repeat protein
MARGQEYSLTDLGVVKDMQSSEASAINNQGDVAGTGHNGGKETCAFHYDYSEKSMEDSGGLNSRGFGISSTNMVVGDSFFGPAMEPRSHAASFQNEVAKDLGVLTGQLYARANGVNTIGQVVGFSGPERDSSKSRAFWWTYQTGMRDMGTLVGGSYAQANAINETGLITGTSRTGAAVVTTHAFTYQAISPTDSGPMRDLGVLGGFSSYGMAINANNHVAGYSTLNANSQRTHAFLHDGNRMIDLGSLGAKGSDSDVSVALGINKLDQVVGHSYLLKVGDLPLQQVAFLWTRNSSSTGSGQMKDLNKLLNGTGKNYMLVSATGINDNGQILANAYDRENSEVHSAHAVLLMPVAPTLEK